MLQEKMTLDEFKDIMERRGEARGIRKGEIKMQLKSAKSMLEDNLPIAMIVKYTGLSEEEIEKLK